MKQNIKRTISNNLFMLNYAVKYTPGYLLCVCLFSIYSTVEVFFEFTYCTKYMIDLIQYNGSFYDGLKYMAIISTAIIIKIIWAAVMTQLIIPKSKEKLHKHIQMEMYEKAVLSDIACYDDPKYYNEFVFCASEANKRVDETINYVDSFLGNITRIFISGLFFIFLDKIGLAFVAASLGLTLAMQSKAAKLKYKMDVELKPVERKRNYINRVFYLNNYAKEIRLNPPIGDRLKSEFNKSNEEMRRVIGKHARKQVIFGFIGDYIANSFILDMLYLIYLLFVGLVNGMLSFGSIISLFNNSGSLKNSLRRISELIPQFQQNSLYIEKIRNFLDYEVHIKDENDAMDVPAQPADITLNNVSFAYNPKDGNVLKNISLTIRPGEKVAFVGYNGAGKTTLIKVLMRLYDVSDGEILYNGVNIKNYKVKSYRDCFGSVFQDYQIYAAKVSENVMMNNVKETDSEVILEALSQSGFSQRLASMDMGIETKLTREFDDKGINLSGGEAQKLAIARVFAKPCPVIILDEPSSALDPISEYELNQAMLKAAEHKTVIFISHRLSTTKMADRIYMLENGRIIEQGIHQELMELNGKYAEMFRLQSGAFL